MGIRIITDSTSDINQVEAKEKGITIVPLNVLFGDNQYKEGIDIDMDTFYEKLVNEKELPTTSQPSPNEFLQYFEEAKEAGDSIVVILLSGQLSGTLQSAVIAKDMLDYSAIYIIDSMSTVTGLRLLVDHAVTLRDKGLGVGEIVKEVEELKERIGFLAIVDTLEYLYKGGRLSRASSIIGSLLNFKPIIELKNGTIAAVGKERGFNKAVMKLFEIIDEQGGIDTNFPVHFGFTAHDEKCNNLREKMKERYELEKGQAFAVGCVVGTHAGPGACVITYIRPK